VIDDAIGESPPQAAVIVRDLRMRFGRREVLHGLDLSVSAGTVFGIVGPNGAGKTTTLETLEGYRRPSTGTISVLGMDPTRAGRAFRERIGILLQEGGVEPYLTVAEVVDATRRMYPRPLLLADLLEIVGLTGQAQVRVRRLSAGQRRRLELALALSGDPDVLFLDEPTVGFDPEARLAAWDAIRRFARSGRTVILATNLMEEAQELADRVAVIVAGKVVAEGSPVEVVGTGGPGSLVRFRLPVGGPGLPPELTRTMAAARDDVVELRTNDPALLMRDLGAWAVRHDLRLADVVISPRSLEDAYLELTGSAAERDATSDDEVVAPRAGSSATHLPAARAEHDALSGGPAQ
jgi:ABC-2 type transport system ATP-binding protein